MYIKKTNHYIHVLEKPGGLHSFFFTLQDCCTLQDIYAFSYAIEGLSTHLCRSDILESTVSTFM